MADRGQLSSTEPKEVHRGSRGKAVAAIAATQHGLITSAQLAAIGVGATTVHHWVSTGRLHRIHRGVFAVGHPRMNDRGRWLAAVLACGDGAVLSHRAAAALHGIRPDSATLIDVSAAGRPGRTRRGIRLHRGEQLRDAEIEVVDRIPCTTVARTIVDLATCVRPGALEYAIHQAQVKRELDRDAIATVVAHLPRRRGNAVLRRLLSLNDRDEDTVRSGNERRFRRLLRDARLPKPLGNHWIALDGHPAGGVEVDFVWPEFRLVVEIDSVAVHSTDRALVNDPRRDRALMLAGWRVIRFTDRDLEETPERVLREMRRFLAGRGTGPDGGRISSPRSKKHA